ncbi:MAG TPA: NAD(P)H-dependent oxidoreductase subunit E [Blastocatellia bacterium]|nr:NAD(P)H-dependent oxidoreductase subunit E [Blastocatellia bacterium]
MVQFSEEAMREYNDIIRRYPAKRAAVIPVLTLAQREFGWISEEVADYIGGLMDYPPADMKSVSSFYVLLRQKPVGKYHLEICRNVSCWLKGATGCMAEAKRILGVEAQEVTPDGLFSWDFTECLASCGTAVAMQVGDRYIENLTPEKMGEVIEQLRREAASQ